MPQKAALADDLRTIAEGPCAKLSVEAAGERRFIVYGDTGYELADWAAGEQLAAAQSLVEITTAGVVRNRLMLEGLPADGRGYVPASLELGVDSIGVPWLSSIDTRYAPRGTGALFERTSRSYSHRGGAWQPLAEGAALDLGPGSLPDVPTAEACESQTLKFVALSHAFARDGGVFIAGRCQDASHIAYADTTLVVAHARKGAKEWELARLPRTSRLDGIVNVALFAHRADDAWLTAFEPYANTNGRPSYLVRFDGSQWREVELDIDEGLMSVAGDAEGNVYFAAGRGLYRRSSAGVVERIPLPPLRFTNAQPELHVRRVSAFSSGELWVEAGYRVTRPTGERGEPASGWASVLFSNRVLPLPLYCDAREMAFDALVEIEGSSP